MSRPVDVQHRERALDCQSSFIVQAPAGSGKTELLTQRYLKLLAQVDRPERILAITFTRKATREMRARIEKRLQQAQAGTALESAHEERAVELGRLALAQDAALGWNLLRNPSRMRILTLDGLCSQYLARDPGAAGVGAGMAVQEDATPLYLETIERLFDHLGGIPEEGDDWSVARHALTDVLVHLDGNAQQLRDLLLSKLASRDQWVKRLGSDTDSLAYVLQDRQQFELDSFLQGLGAERYSQASEYVCALGANVNQADHPAARFAVACEADEAGVEAEILRAWHFSRVFFTSNGLRSPGFNKSTFPGLADSLKPIMEELRTIYAGWMEQGPAQAALLRMGKAPPLELDGNARELQQNIVIVLQHALAELRVLFAEQAQCDFHHVTEMALQSLGDESEPGALLLAEDLRLEHILMDEFQDTSNTQYELLRRLISGWSGPSVEPGHSSRSLFLVGDPMQSIYRFREANVGLFIDVVQQKKLGEVPLECLQLQANFRSGAGLVSWINPQFQQIFPASDKSDAGAVRYASAVAAVGEGGQVSLHPFAADATHTDEAEYVVQLIEQARAEFDDPSIAILARGRSHLSAIVAQLQQHGLEYEAVKVGALETRPVIQDLLSLTRALCHPADRPAWLALLRAPWCALNVAELHQVVGQNSRTNLLQCILQAEGLADRTSAERVKRLGQVMQLAVLNPASQSLRDRVEQAWRALGGEYCYASPVESENSGVFFRLLESLENESNEQLVERLHSRMNKLFATSSSARLQLMPIHQAKGLEFDVVIIPGMQRLPSRGEANLVELQEFRLADGQNATLMAPIPSHNKPEASLYRYLQAIDKERSAYETQRVLYVACTRARQQLHLLGRFRESKDKGLYAPKGSLMELVASAFEGADLVLPASATTDQPDRQIADTIGASTAHDPGVIAEIAGVGLVVGRSPTGKDVQATITLPLLRLAEEALPPLPPRAAESEPWQWRPLPNRDAAALGQAVHNWLELMHDHWSPQWSNNWFSQQSEVLKSSLLQAGASQAALPDLLPQLQSILSSIIQSEIAERIVSPEGKADSWAELPLLRRDGNRISRHIIDRLYELDGELTIVDYKTGADSIQSREQWIAQLHRYRELAQKLEVGRVTRTLILQANDNELIDLSRDAV